MLGLTSRSSYRPQFPYVHLSEYIHHYEVEFYDVIQKRSVRLPRILRRDSYCWPFVFVCGQFCMTQEKTGSDHCMSDTVRRTFWEVVKGEEAAGGGVPEVRELWGEESDAFWTLNEVVALEVRRAVGAKDDSDGGKKVGASDGIGLSRFTLYRLADRKLLASAIFEDMHGTSHDDPEERHLTRSHLIRRFGTTLKIHHLPTLAHLHTFSYMPILRHLRHTVPLDADEDIKVYDSHDGTGDSMYPSEDGTVLFLMLQLPWMILFRVLVDAVNQTFWIVEDGPLIMRSRLLERSMPIYAVVRERRLGDGDEDGVNSAGFVEGVGGGELKVYFRSRDCVDKALLDELRGENDWREDVWDGGDDVVDGADDIVNSEWGR
ncbi:hypothetical protein HDV00_007920 [Rhizophlyctis rosea]|nr:hypothetical protein HDV00_007920 [Rhizophlyctis rosea]